MNGFLGGNGNAAIEIRLANNRCAGMVEFIRRPHFLREFHVSKAVKVIHGYAIEKPILW